MREVFNSDNFLEAHVVSHLLEQNSIKTTITGEYLKSAIGEIPVNSQIKVFVLDDADYNAALKIIGEFERNNNSQTNQSRSQPTQEKLYNRYGFLLGFIALILSILLGAGFFRVYQNYNITYDGIDYNGDNKDDVSYEYKDNILSSVETDRNFDGKTDLKDGYDVKGLIETSVADEDFDGKFETSSKFENGNVIVEEINLKKDNHPIFVYIYKSGILSERLMKDYATQIVVKHDFFSPFSLKYSLYDSNRDGFFDKKYTYDFYEEIINTEDIKQKVN